MSCAYWTLTTKLYVKCMFCAIIILDCWQCGGDVTVIYLSLKILSSYILLTDKLALLKA